MKGRVLGRSKPKERNAPRNYPLCPHHEFSQGPPRHIVRHLPLQIHIHQRPAGPRPHIVQLPHQYPGTILLPLTTEFAAPVVIRIASACRN